MEKAKSRRFHRRYDILPANNCVILLFSFTKKERRSLILTWLIISLKFQVQTVWLFYCNFFKIIGLSIAWRIQDQDRSSLSQASYQNSELWVSDLVFSLKWNIFEESLLYLKSFFELHFYLLPCYLLNLLRKCHFYQSRDRVLFHRHRLHLIMVCSLLLSP